ncbi:retrovirus-related pol polyprotein from transposon TNT 1-94 [Tanacetum coccineum]
MNMDQDRQMLMVEDNVGNQFRPNAVQNFRNQVVLNAVQNPGVQNVGNQNGISVDPGISNQYSIRDVVTAWAEGNGNGINGNQIRCYNCQGVDHHASNCTIKPGKRDAAYLQKQMQIAQKEEAGIQLTQEEFDFMADAGAYEDIKKVNANCTLKDNLQQASTSGTQTDKAPIYDSGGSAEINALHLSSAKTITTLNEEIANLNKTLSKENSTVSSLLEENKNLKSDFKIREDELLDKQIQLENKIKEIDNILVKTEKHDPSAVYDSEETLELAQESRLKTKQLNKEIKPANYTKINHLSGVFVSQMAKSREELHFSNTSKTTNVSKSISIPNEQFSDDTTPSVARKFLNGVKSTIVTLQPKFVRDFKSLEKEADESIVKQKALELEIKRLLKVVVSQDIMSVVLNPPVVETSDLQTDLERTKERFENCIIKKENEYAKLWNDWYKKCEECKYDKISYDKAYNDMQQKIERLQAQLGDLRGKSKDTSCVSDTLDPLPQKLENENVELEFQIRNYEKENGHLKAVYKNLFDSINVTRTQTKTIIDSLQTILHDTIYENAKLRAQLFDKVSEQKDTTRGTSANTKFAKQSILGKPPSSSRPKVYVVTPLPTSTAIPKVCETNTLSNQVTSNSFPSSHESKVVKNDNVIALGMFRIDPRKTSRKDNFVPNKHVKASVRTKPITVSQPHVIIKNDVNSKTNGFSLKDVKSTTRTRRPQPSNNPKKDKSSSNQEHMSSECKNIKLALWNAKSEFVCAMCKQCLITANHDVCVLNYVNDMNSRALNKNANVSIVENQKKHKPKVRKPKKVGSKERLVSPKPSTPISCLRWSPTGRMFDLKGKIITTSESVSQSDCSKSDNACTSNLQEPISKRFPNSTFSMTSCQNWLNTLLIPLLSEYKPKDKEIHQDNECDN